MAGKSMNEYDINLCDNLKGVYEKYKSLASTATTNCLVKTWLLIACYTCLPLNTKILHVQELSITHS